HHQALKLWLRVLACTNKIEGEIRGRLRSNVGTTLPRFDLMAQLERNPAGLKMNELSARLMVTGGNVTGITDQLEKEGLVVRVSGPQRPRRLYGEADAGGPLGVRQDGGGSRAMGRRPVRGIERRRKGADL